MPRHFDETALASRVPDPVRAAAFQEIAINSSVAFDAVEAALPDDFPERIAAPILSYGRDRLRLVQDFAEKLQ